MPRAVDRVIEDLRLKADVGGIRVLLEIDQEQPLHRIHSDLKRVEKLLRHHCAPAHSAIVRKTSIVS